MKTNLLVLIVTIFSIQMLSCSRSGTKALERGKYYEAVVQATEKLSRDAKNEKAAAVLPKAYEGALSEILGEIDFIRKSSKAFRWEESLQQYVKLNQLYETIQGCRTCKRLVNARDFYKETEEARDLAASERYNAAMNLLIKKDKMAARDAYAHLDKIIGFAPNYRDVRKQMEVALHAGSTHVVLEQPTLNSRIFQYSNDYLQDKINDFLNNNRRMNKYIRFYTPAEAKAEKLIADQVVRLEIIDFVVGQISHRSDTRKITSKDSVKVGEAKIEGKKVDVFNTVSAEFSQNSKVVKSSGVLLMEIYDYQKDKKLFSEEIVGEYTWVNEWARFNGDERALTKEQKELTKRSEDTPPAPQRLFVEFCKPIYDQTTSRLKRFYEKY